MCRFYSLYHFFSLAVNHCHLLSLNVICSHSLYHLLPLAVIHCHLFHLFHSLSLVVIRCHSLYHWLSLVVSRCHLLSFNVPLVCLFINDVSTTDPAFAYLTYLFFFYLLAGPVKVHVKYQRRKLLQQQKAVNQDLFYPLAVPIKNNGLFEKTWALFNTKISKKTCNLGRV